MPSYRDLDTGEILTEDQFNQLPETPEHGPTRISFLRNQAGQAQAESSQAQEAARFSNVAGPIFGSAFGGEKIGEAIGAGAARLGLTGLTPEQRKNVSFPSVGEVAGDVAQTGLTIAGLKGAGTAGKLLPRILKTGVLGAGFGVAGALKAGETEPSEIAKGAGIGTAIGGGLPLVGSILGGLGTAATKVAQYLSSTLSNVPQEAITQAFKNPNVVRNAIQRAVADGTELTAQKIHTQALEALQTLKSVRGQAYEEGLQAIEKQLEGRKAPVSLLGVKSVATRTLRDFGLIAKRGEVEIGESALQRSQVGKIQDLLERVYSWKNLTPLGLNNLRKVIDGYKLGGINLSSSDKMFNKIIGTLRTNVSQYVGERIPAIQALNKEYAAQSEVIDNIVQQLKLGRGDPNTALRKLLNVFNPKSEVYRPIVKELGEKASVDLMSDIAGLTMAQWTPSGLGRYLTLLGGSVGVGAGIFEPTALASIPITAAASSPRIIGRFATTAGKIAPTIGKITQPARRIFRTGILRESTTSRP